LQPGELTLHAGRLVVVAGPSGSGKTTLLDRLSGLLDEHGSHWQLQPASGGEPLQLSGAAGARQLRQLLAYAPQQAVLFEASLRHNLLLDQRQPAAVIAGTLATASQVDHMHPMMTWATGMIAGGGAAGVTQLATISTRGVSTIVSGGTLSPIVTPVMATVQAVIAIALSVLAVVVPIIAAMVLLGVLSIALVLIIRHWNRADERRALA
jgi:energy-coupling factor transporter ATP-binding protein EcfA2